MKRDVTQCEFSDAFRDMGRGDSFSYEGLKALYDWLIYMEDGLDGEEFELDVIVLCCDFSEYGTAVEAAEEYGYEPEHPADLIDITDEEVEEREEAAFEWLNERTMVIVFDGGVIIQGF